MDEVDLYVAFGWLCPKCEAQNYCDGVMLEMTDDDKEDFEKELSEMGEEEGSDWISMPNIVKCKKCLVRFKVIQEVEE